MKYNVEMTNGDLWETDFEEAGRIPQVGPLYLARLLFSEGVALPSAGTMAVCFVVANIVVIFEVVPREATNGDR